MEPEDSKAVFFITLIACTANFFGFIYLVLQMVSALITSDACTVYTFKKVIPMDSSKAVAIQPNVEAVISNFGGIATIMSNKEVEVIDDGAVLTIKYQHGS